jgi:hypothetical protein
MSANERQSLTGTTFLATSHPAGSVTDLIEQLAAWHPYRLFRAQRGRYIVSAASAPNSCFVGLTRQCPFGTQRKAKRAFVFC